jgi:hypothetical protein
MVGGLFAFGDKYSPLEVTIDDLDIVWFILLKFFYGTGGAVIGALLCL